MIGVDAVEKWKSLVSAGNQTPVIQLVARHYTELIPRLLELDLVHILFTEAVLGLAAHPVAALELWRHTPGTLGCPRQSGLSAQKLFKSVCDVTKVWASNWKQNQAMVLLWKRGHPEYKELALRRVLFENSVHKLSRFGCICHCKTPWQNQHSISYMRELSWLVANVRPTFKTNIRKTIATQSENMLSGCLPGREDLPRLEKVSLSQ